MTEALEALIEKTHKEEFINEFELAMGEGSDCYKSQKYPNLTIWIRELICIADEGRYVKITDSWDSASEFLRSSYRK